MSYARWQDAETIIEREGMILQEPVLNSKGELKGYRKVKHPALGIAKDEKANMRSFGQLFGLDPTNRTRIIVPTQGLTSEQKLERLLNGEDEA